MDTNKPTLPGFTAEAGLYMTRNHYRLAADGTDAGRTLIVPQRDDLRCGIYKGIADWVCGRDPDVGHCLTALFNVFAAC